MSRYARAVDVNHAEIVEALRSVGASVQSLAVVGKGCPDLLVGFRRTTFLLEVKDGEKAPSRRCLTPLEESWHSTWRGGPVGVVCSPRDALVAIGALWPTAARDEEDDGAG